MARLTANGGIRGGTPVTHRYESLQAYTCAARALHGKPLNDIDEVKSILNEQEKGSIPKLIKGAAPLRSAMANISESYYHSCITIANQMFVDYPFIKADTHGFRKGNDTRIQAVYNEFHKLKKGSGIVNANKWNPADMWVVHNNFRPKTGFDSIEDLNHYMLDQFNSGMLMGVSLKKVGPRSNAVGIVYNKEPTPMAKFSGFRINGGLLDSKDTYIDFRINRQPGSIQLRVFSAYPIPSQWQGEIVGTSAAGGKIGGNIMVGVANDHGANIPTAYTIAGSYLMRPQDSTIKKFIDYWKEVKGITSLPMAEQKKLIEGTKEKIKEDPTWWLSKYVSLHYCVSIKKSGKMDKVVNQVYKYAASSLDNSCVFVKYGPR